VSQAKLDSLLEMALRTSVAIENDPFHEELSCHLQPFTLLQKLYADIEVVARSH
jgi:hypothetical protein